jgi:hypothetical protein
MIGVNLDRLLYTLKKMMPMHYTLLFISTLSACNFLTDKDQESRLDPDKDGVLWPNDCDDSNSNIGEAQNWYLDEDGDGYGTEDSVVLSCSQPESGVGLYGDCDDSDPDSSPGAEEVWYNNIDENCDGNSDFDQDQDGEDSLEFGGSDCDDTDSSINSNAVEIYYDGIDGNCDNMDDCDADGDGFPSALNGTATDACPDVSDCDDNNPNIFPNETEEVPLNGIDDDCNLHTGDGDQDGDGFWLLDYEEQMSANNIQIQVYVPSTRRDCWDAPIDTSDIPSEFVPINDFQQLTPELIFPWASDSFYDGVDANCQEDNDFDMDLDGFTSDVYQNREGSLGQDCNDSDNFIFPGAFDEYYDGIDANCENDNDFDQDGDGDGSLLYLMGGDCDDLDPTVNSFEFIELPADGVDQNCDSQEACYTDSDLDGFGSSLTTFTNSLDCSVSGVSSVNTDCDDNSAFTYPGAAPNDSSSDCMEDGDQDGYGNATPNSTDVIAGSDCFDSDSSIYPNAQEVLSDGIDQDCDGFESCFVDFDSDGFRNTDPTLSILSLDLDCSDSGEGESSDPPNDCDDNSSDTFPGAAAFDSTVSCMKDLDNDEFGDSNTFGGIISGSDCNDNSPNINPYSDETIDNSTDEDCDGFELCYLDSDSDNFRAFDLNLTVFSSDLDCDDLGEGSTSEAATDCDDNSSDTFPGAAWVDSSTLCMKDSDQDGFGDENPIINISPGTDCNDSDPNVNPSQPEIPNNNFDDDCDPTTNDDPNNPANKSYSGNSNNGNYGHKVLFKDMTSPIYSALAVKSSGKIDQPDGVGYGQIDFISDLGGNSRTYSVIGSRDFNISSGEMITLSDLNGDGREEVAISGTNTQNQNIGSDNVVLLFSNTDFDTNESKGITDVINTTGALVINHTNELDLFGSALSFDGSALYVGAPNLKTHSNYNAGAVFKYPVSLISQTHSSIDSRAFKTVYYSVTSSAHFGSKIGSGDLNGDGVKELLVGANGWNQTDRHTDFSQIQASKGRISIFDGNGQQESVLDEDADIQIIGHSNMALGRSFIVEDINADGNQDLIIGIPEDGQGSVRIFLGSSLSFGSTIHALSSDIELISNSINSSEFGYDVSILGDINDDGFLDLGIGDPSDSGLNHLGAAHIFYGPIHINSTSETFVTKTDQFETEFGYSLTGGADINSDGIQDFVVGAPSYTENDNFGSVFLFYGTAK